MVDRIVGCDFTERKWCGAGQKKSNDDNVTFIYAGNPAKKDCLHVVINSMQKACMKGYRFTLFILGVTREQYLKANSELLNTIQLSDRIVFMGKVPQDVVPSYYGQSDFMVLIREPNRKSMAGFPTKFAESFTAGIPVVANLTSDLDQFLLDGQTGFIVNDNTEGSLDDVLDRIAKLSQTDIIGLKKNVSEMAQRFDYRYYIDAFKRFISDLI